jgi:hypothetical protein
MFRTAEISVGAAGTDADVKALFESLQVRQEGNRAILAAILPGGFLRKLGESPEQPSAPAASSPQRR